MPEVGSNIVIKHYQCYRMPEVGSNIDTINQDSDRDLGKTKIRVIIRTMTRAKFGEKAMLLCFSYSSLI
jgi:hypothetical protein